MVKIFYLFLPCESKIFRSSWDHGFGHVSVMVFFYFGCLVVGGIYIRVFMKFLTSFILIRYIFFLIYGTNSNQYKVLTFRQSCKFLVGYIR